jgi:hypothetical protein
MTDHQITEIALDLLSSAMEMPVLFAEFEREAHAKDLSLIEYARGIVLSAASQCGEAP